MKKAKEGEHMRRSKIMVVDDDADIRQALRVLLEKENYEVEEADNGETALELLDETVDLMILDIMMPGKDGLATCKKVRETYTFPILFLTAKTTENDKYMGFSSGGDDYLTKPFSQIEILSRISAMLRRYCIYQGKRVEENYICIKDLRIDKTVSCVYQGEREILLTNTEYELLLFMAKNPNKVFTLEELYENIWNEPYHFSVNATVMVHIRNLRRKLHDTSQASKYIKNIWGKGYAITDERNEKKVSK